MSGITVRVDVKEATRLLNDVARRQVPYAAARAVNALAFEVMRTERAAMPHIFDHPRPFTERGTVVLQKASKSNPTAIIGLRPEVEKYLEPYEFGGHHVLPSKKGILNNPKNLPLDAYGQVRPGTMARLAAARTAPVGTGKKRRGRGTIPAGSVFNGPPKNHPNSGDGFWMRVTLNGVRHLVLLTRKGDDLLVHKHLNFRVRATQLVNARFTQVLSAELERALASAR